MASLAERLKQKLFGVPSVSSVATSSAIRNSRKSGFVSSDPFESTEQNKYAYGTLRYPCLLYTSPSPRDLSTSRMPSSA